MVPPRYDLRALSSRLTNDAHVWECGMTIGAGLGQPGAREITHITPASEVITPWRIWKRSSTVKTLEIWGIYLAMYIIWFWVAAALSYHPQYNATWRALIAGLRTTWPRILWFFPAPLLATIVAWIYYGNILLRYRYVPEQKNRNFPPLYNPVDVTQVGMLTAENADDLLAESAPEPPAERVVRVEVTQNGGQQTRIAHLPDVPGLAGFARAVSNGQAFNEATARRFHIGREHWEMIRDQCLQRSLVAWKDAMAHQQGIEMRPVGRAVFRHVAGIRSSFVAPKEEPISNKSNGGEG